MKGIPVREELTDEWKKRGGESNLDYAILTNEISRGTFGITTNQHKELKKLDKKKNLRDNISPLELALTTLAEVTTTEIHRAKDSHSMVELKIDARKGGNIPSETRVKIEQEIGKSVLTSETSIDFKEKKEKLY